MTIAKIKATPILCVFSDSNLPVQLLSEKNAKVSVVALTTVLLGKLELVFWL